MKKQNAKLDYKYWPKLARKTMTFTPYLQPCWLESTVRLQRALWIAALKAVLPHTHVPADLQTLFTRWSRRRLHHRQSQTLHKCLQCRPYFLAWGHNQPNPATPARFHGRRHWILRSQVTAEEGKVNHGHSALQLLLKAEDAQTSPSASSTSTPFAASVSRLEHQEKIKKKSEKS